LGTSKRPVNTINEELDFMGASLSSSSGRDYATLSLKVLKKDLDKGLDLFMEVLTQPTFPEEEIRRDEKTLAPFNPKKISPMRLLKRSFKRPSFSITLMVILSKEQRNPLPSSHGKRSSDSIDPITILTTPF
jgi:hypothetical protein